MYKRPPLRVREEYIRKIHDPVKLRDCKIFTNEPTKWYTQIKQPVYQKDVYLTLLKKNYETCGVEYKEPDIPEYVPPVVQEKLKEPMISCVDHVHMKLRILKSGIIRVKLDTSFASMYEKYYSKNKLPPIKTLIQAYKSMGFSEAFLTQVNKKYERNLAFFKRVSPAIDAIFSKEPVKKVKKKKKEEVEVIEDDEIPVDEEPDDPDEDDDDPGEDGEMDVEVDEDIEDEQPPEDVYISDGDD
jgi:cobalamin biosynthesis Mg chelatase CobN